MQKIEEKIKNIAEILLDGGLNNVERRIFKTICKNQEESKPMSQNQTAWVHFIHKKLMN